MRVNQPNIKKNENIKRNETVKMLSKFIDTTY